MDTCTVTEQIRSHGKDKKIYAEKGAKCNIVAKMSDMWILENEKTGEKFSCHLDKILIQ